MSNYYKPQTPLAKGNDFIYPLTTADQVLLEDGSRLNAKVVMAALDDVEDGEDYNPDEVLVNAESLGGIPANSYMLKTDTAANSTKLNGKPASDYLLKTDEVENSAKLNGKPASDYSLREDTVFSINGNMPDNNGNVVLTASDVGARSSTWMPTASDVGAAESSELGNYLHLAGGTMTGTLFNKSATFLQATYDSASRGMIFRKDSNTFYMLITNEGDVNGQWNSFRPLTIDLETGVCNISGNAATATNSTKFNNKTWAEMLLTIYPVGYIYMSLDSTSPASLFGGTWERITDRFLLGGRSDTYPIGSTGGSATHTLTIDEMPRHFHQFRGWWNTDHTGDHKVASYEVVQGDAESVDSSCLHVGGSQAHNNMPPYLAVYMWKRTA